MARKTNAQLAAELEVLTAQSAERDAQVALLLEAYQEKVEEVEAVKADAKKTKKKKGIKRGRTIRNNTRAVFHTRIGDPEKPFRIKLEPHGLRGDTTVIPESLLEDPNYQQNLKLGVFAEIEQDEALAIDYGRPTGPVAEQRAQLVRTEETVVSRRDPNDPTKQLRTGPVGPAQVQQSQQQVVDPDWAAFQAWKASQGGQNVAEHAAVQSAVNQSQSGLLDRIREAAASGDADAMRAAAQLEKLVGDGFIPQGELTKPVRVVREQGPSVAPQVP